MGSSKTLAVNLLCTNMHGLQLVHILTSGCHVLSETKRAVFPLLLLNSTDNHTQQCYFYLDTGDEDGSSTDATCVYVLSGHSAKGAEECRYSRTTVKWQT